VKVIATTTAVVALLLPSTARGDLRPDRIAFWDRIANCETGGNWRMRGSTYEGGVGFAVTTWRWWAGKLGLLARYPHAYLAPRLVQIRVAEYGLLTWHGYWGCNR